MEARMFMRRAQPESFRTYMLVAENSVGISSHQVQLLQSKIFQDNVYMACVISSVKSASRCRSKIFHLQITYTWLV